LAPQTEAKKVKVKAKLSQHMMFSIESAQLVEEEEYEEKVKEKREVEPSPEDAAKTAEEATKPAVDEAAKAEGEPAKPEGEGEQKVEKNEPEKKFEWVDVVKKKKRTKRTDIPVVRSGTPGLTDAELQKLRDVETAMQVEMAEILETDARRNDLEAYIFTMRDKCSEGGEYGDFIANLDREAFQSVLSKKEDWLYDTVDGTKVMYIEKLEELKKVGDPVVWRFKESQIRAEWVAALSGTISNYKAAAEAPGDKYGHIDPAKLAKITKECDAISQWLASLQAKQSTLAKHEKPVLLCADMEKKNQELAKLADEILKEPKPRPPAEETKEELPKDDKQEEPPKDGAPPNPDVD